MVETPLIAAPPPRLPVPTDSGECGYVITRAHRVALRTLVPSDLHHFSAWADDPFLELMVGSEFLRSYKHVYDKHPSFYEACLNDPTQVVLAIVANGGEPRPLGLVRLFNIHLLEGYAFLETMITDQKALRRGFGVEAGKLISAYGVDVLGLRRIEAKVYEYNVPSINALKRHGFKQEGVLRKAGYQGGQVWDVLVFGLLREELEEQRRKENFYFPFEDGEGDGSESP
jgi:RimJ/RimL family protein N-acetyltransferase